MKIESTVKRYKKQNHNYILEDEYKETVSETWYNTYINLLVISFSQGKKITVVKDGEKIKKTVLTSGSGEYKTEREFIFG